MTNSTANAPAETQESPDHWPLHYFADDLKLFVEIELPRIDATCSAAELRPIREKLQEFERFCSGQDDPPQVQEVPAPAEDSSPVQLLLSDFGSYCRQLAQEWQHLDRPTRRRLRSRLARVLHRGGTSGKEGDDVHWSELVLSSLALMAWLVLFAIGYTMHAKPYEDVIKEPLASIHGISEMAVFIGALLMFIVACIPTNVLLLACVTGTLGTAYRRATGHREDGHQRSRAHDYLCALTTSFFVYLILIGGMLSLSVAEILTYESQEKYLKLAGTISMCAFLVGYDRNIVAWMLRRVATFLTQSDKVAT
ncbi:MAG: hypothetical protein JSS49_14605 [Planctomycetes bacterium]|nr:hypothetical protein [Planctomycetota bacterium]